MIKLFALGCLILAFVGCGGVIPPKVQYAEYPKLVSGTSASDASGYQFRHRRSVIKLEYEKDKGGLTACAVPYELNADGSYSTLYRVWGDDGFQSTTQLKVSYIDNTKFIDQLQVTTKDNINDAISKIGGFAAAAVPFVASVVAAKEEVIKFNRTMVDPVQTGIDQWTKDPQNKDYCVRLKNVVSESTLSLKQYVADGLGKWQGAFPVPACATGVVEIAKPCDDDNIVFSSRVTFADADKVLPVNLPSSGKVKMNSACGASVTEDDKQDRTAMLDYLNTAITQIQTVSTAWKKAKPATTTSTSTTTETPKIGK
jgi:hypothetical protein